jgi:hypothetical protein
MGSYRPVKTRVIPQPTAPPPLASLPLPSPRCKPTPLLLPRRPPLILPRRQTPLRCLPVSTRPSSSSLHPQFLPSSPPHQIARGCSNVANERVEFSWPCFCAWPRRFGGSILKLERGVPATRTNRRRRREPQRAVIRATLLGASPPRRVVWCSALGRRFRPPLLTGGGFRGSPVDGDAEDAPDLKAGCRRRPRRAGARTQGRPWRRRSWARGRRQQGSSFSCNIDGSVNFSIVVPCLWGLCFSIMLIWCWYLAYMSNAWFCFTSPDELNAICTNCSVCEVINLVKIVFLISLWIKSIFYICQDRAYSPISYARQSIVFAKRLLFYVYFVELNCISSHFMLNVLHKCLHCPCSGPIFVLINKYFICHIRAWNNIFSAVYLIVNGTL